MPFSKAGGDNTYIHSERKEGNVLPILVRRAFGIPEIQNPLVPVPEVVCDDQQDQSQSAPTQRIMVQAGIRELFRGEPAGIHRKGAVDDERG